MAVELGRFLTDQLARLPANHPDRAFLQGLQQSTAAYVERSHPAVIAEEVSDHADEPKPSAAELTGPIPSEPSEPSAMPPSETGEAEPPMERRERQPRIRLQGRVVVTPDFRTTSRGIRRGHFPLATHPDADTTVFYDVYAFNKPGRPLADRLQELKLQRGQQVEVIGYDHPVDGTTKDGRPKPHHVYAAAPIKAR